MLNHASRFIIAALLGVFVNSTLSFSCPESDQKWHSWVKNSLQTLKKDHLFLNLNPIAAQLDTCPQSRLVSKCLQPLKSFALRHYETSYPGYSMGMTISDQEYLNQNHQVGVDRLPESLLEPQLLAQIDKDITVQLIDKIRERAKKSGFSKVIVFPYRSQHVASIDEAKTKGRLFVLLENSKKLIVSQFNIDSTTGKPPESISIIGVDKMSGMAFFNDLHRIRRNRSISIANRLHINGRLEDCSRCHKSVFIPINPDDSFDYDTYVDDLSDANSIMNQYRYVKWAYKPKIDPKEPILGVEDLSRIKECAAGYTTPKVYADLELAVRCQECHNHKANTALNFPSGLGIQLSESQNLAQRFILHYKLMPPGFDDIMDDGFAKVIYRCIYQDMYGSDTHAGRLFEYLENQACFNDLAEPSGDIF